ncbi:glycoside hydrolase domain-containing protein [Gulosibacter sediminis]|uniref:glycoside hydrolase domain-containing protein n=1 Tax=Gulosibacter sediminis TaxID=1729695 RepID=UPI0024AD99D7|nr:glycoside hydrolase domain-containing protein [Gulosibacter sediminis]
MADPKVDETQQWLNATYGNHAQWNNITENGQIGWPTIYGMIRALQIELGITTLSDNFGDATMARLTTQFPKITPLTSKSNVRRIAQSALWCHGYLGGYDWGTFDTDTNTGIKTFAIGAGLADDATSVPSEITPKMLKGLLTLEAYSLVSGGDPKIREAQQWINRTYLNRKQDLLPCDGIFTRSTQQGLVTVIQYEIGMTDSQANGNFGPGTKSGLQSNGNISSGTTDSSTKHWVRLFQCALRMNGYSAPLNGVFDASTVSTTKAFQNYAELSGSGNANFQTWASLLISTGDDTRPGIASDMATQLYPVACEELYNNGYRTVGRYLTVLSKRYKAKELDYIFDAGLETFPIMQEANTGIEHFSNEKGKDHAIQAIRRLRQLGFKTGNTVFFSVDFDANGDQINSNIIPFFRGIKSVIGGSRKQYKVGVYGTRNVCSKVIEAGLAEEAFIASMSWGWGGNLGFPLPPNWSYDQIWNGTLPSSIVSLEIDKDIQSSRANPASRADVRVTPTIKVPVDVGGTEVTDDFDENYFWYLCDILMQADLVSTSAERTTKDVLHWLSTQKYNNVAWNAYLPYDLDAGDAEIMYRLKQIAPPIPELTFDRFTHWAATTRGYLLHWNNKPLPGAGHAWIGDLGGWGFDLATAWDDYLASGSSLGVRQWMAQNVGTVSPQFGRDDFIEDIDGFLTAKMLRDNPDQDLDECIRQIEVACMADSSWRYKKFIERRFGGSAAEIAAAGAEIFTDDAYWMLADGFVDGPRPSTSEAAQIGLGFADAVKTLAGI